MSDFENHDLLSRLWDGDLDSSTREELNSRLRVSPELRAGYLRLARVHGLLHAEGERLEGATDPSPVRPRFSGLRRLTTGLALAAACLVLAMFWSSRDPGGESPEPVAMLETRSARWNGAGPDDGPAPLGLTLELRSGFARLNFQSGVEVTLEGPCRFTVRGPLSLEVVHGRAAVKVPPPVDAFVVSTPAGDFVDLGTEFGIAVGSDGRSPVVLTDVYDGEIEIRPTSLEPERLRSGEGRALLGAGPDARLVADLDLAPVSLPDLRRELPTGPGRTPAEDDEALNLALGKPVFAPAYLTRPHGSVFPPSNLTDGRGNDSGVPGDWSFWLAPEGEAGEFTVDLLESHLITRVELENTRNRQHDDRGMRRFRLLVSEDNARFEEVLVAELARVPRELETFPRESFYFPPIRARYVRVEGLDYFRHPARDEFHPHQGGGLNEIRIFAD